jgi:hypothetical protein
MRTCSAEKLATGARWLCAPREEPAGELLLDLPCFTRWGGTAVTVERI